MQMLKKKLEELKGRSTVCRRNGTVPGKSDGSLSNIPLKSDRAQSNIPAKSDILISPSPLDEKKFPLSHKAAQHRQDDLLGMIKDKLEDEMGKEKDKDKEERHLAAYIHKESGDHDYKTRKEGAKDSSGKEPPDYIASYLDEQKWHDAREEDGYHMMKGSIWAMVSRHETLTMSRSTLLLPLLLLTIHSSFYTLPCVLSLSLALFPVISRPLLTP